MMIEKTYCLYTMKNASSMTCPTTWHSDVVYSEHVLSYACVWKTFFLALSNNPRSGHVQKFVKKEDLKVNNNK